MSRIAVEDNLRRRVQGSLNSRVWRWLRELLNPRLNGGKTFRLRLRLQRGRLLVRKFYGQGHGCVSLFELNAWYRVFGKRSGGAVNMGKCLWCRIRTRSRSEKSSQVKLYGDPERTSPNTRLDSAGFLTPTMPPHFLTNTTRIARGICSVARWLNLLARVKTAWCSPQEALRSRV